jgi:hypothetical protein
VTTAATSSPARRPRRRLTKAERQRREAMTRSFSASPDLERDLVEKLVWLLQEHPADLAGAIAAVDADWFTVPDLRTVFDAMTGAVEAGDVRVATVNANIAKLDATDGVTGRSAAKAVLVDSLAALAGMRYPAERIRRDIELAAEPVAEAHRQRVELGKALDVIRDAGLPLVGPATAAPRALAMPAKRGLPVIELRPGTRADVTDQAEQLLAGEYFARGDRLVRVSTGIGGPMIEAATKESVADSLERLAAFAEVFEVAGGHAKTMCTDCPSWLSAVLVGKQRWPSMRQLRGIAHGPFVRPDGTIGGTKPGYDIATGLLVMTDHDWSGLVDTPTADDVWRAKNDLLDVIKDFPFEADHADVGRAVWLAAVLTVIGRPAFRGPSPMFVFDATTPGSGKTLLARLVSIIAHGCEPSLAGMPEAKAELGKTMTAILQRGATLHIFDNVSGTIGNSVLDQLLTSWTYQDRRLGTNETIEAENRLTLIATANNARIGADTARRSLTLRLQPLVDNPEDLVFERNAADHARENRPRLLAAAVTILRWGFMQAEAGRLPVKPFGSFEGWSDAIRLAVLHAGLPDPLESQKLVRRMDDGSQLRAAFLDAWEGWRPGFVGTARKMISQLFALDDARQFVDDTDGAEKMRAVVMDLTNCAKAAAGSEEAKKLGVVLREMRGRIYNGRSIETDRRSEAGMEWHLLTSRRPGDEWNTVDFGS